MREGPFLRRVPQEHADNVPHRVLDLDDEHFLFIADKNGASAVRGEDSANLDGYNVILHGVSLWRCGQKTSVPVRAIESGKMREKSSKLQHPNSKETPSSKSQRSGCAVPVGI